MMEARVKPSNRHNTVLACGGVEFVKYEWRDVPKHGRAEASRHLMLDTRTATEIYTRPVLSDMTVDELKQLARTHGVSAYYRMRKDELVDALIGTGI